jgi:hypothetical protein
VADEPVEEADDLVARGLATLVRERVDLGERALEAMGDLHVAPAQRAHQLHVVVSGHRVGGPVLHHVADDPDAVEAARAAVDEVADEDGPAPLRMRVNGTAVGELPRAPLHRLVAQQPEQLLELGGAAVDVADHVERPALTPPVVPERRPLDHRRLHRLRRVEHVDLPEALPLQPPEPPPQLPLLVADHVRAEGTVGPVAVALLAEALRQVEHDRDGQEVVPARQLDQRPPRLRLDVGRVDDRQTAPGHPRAGDVVEELEGVVGRVLGVLVVGDQPAAEVGRHDLGRAEVGAGERRLAAAGRTDQQDERELGDLERLAHAASNTAIWVGAPSAGSSGPTGRNRTR